MTTSAQSFADLSDGHLLAAVHRLATDERRATVRLIASLVELDERRLYLAEPLARAAAGAASAALRLERQPSGGSIGAIIRPRIEGNRCVRGSLADSVDDRFE